MQSAYLQLKHPKILRTSGELSWLNFFSGVYHPQDVPDEKSVHEQQLILRRLLSHHCLIAALSPKENALLDEKFTHAEV